MVLFLWLLFKYIIYIHMYYYYYYYYMKHFTWETRGASNVIFYREFTTDDNRGVTYTQQRRRRHNPDATQKEKNLKT